MTDRRRSREETGWRFHSRFYFLRNEHLFHDL